MVLAFSEQQDKESMKCGLGFGIILFIIGWIVFGTAYQEQVKQAKLYHWAKCNTTSFEMILTESGGFGLFDVQSGSECSWRYIRLFYCDSDNYYQCFQENSAKFNTSEWDCIYADPCSGLRLDFPKPIASTSGVVSIIFIISGTMFIVMGIIGLHSAFFRSS